MLLPDLHVDYIVQPARGLLKSSSQQKTCVCGVGKSAGARKEPYFPPFVADMCKDGHLRQSKQTVKSLLLVVCEIWFKKN